MGPGVAMETVASLHSPLHLQTEKKWAQSPQLAREGSLPAFPLSSFWVSISYGSVVCMCTWVCVHGCVYTVVRYVYMTVLCLTV